MDGSILSFTNRLNAGKWRWAREDSLAFGPEERVGATFSLGPKTRSSPSTTGAELDGSRASELEAREGGDSPTLGSKEGMAAMLSLGSKRGSSPSTTGGRSRCGQVLPYWGSPRGDKIRSGYKTLAVLRAHMWANRLHAVHRVPNLGRKLKGLHNPCCHQGPNVGEAAT